MNVVEDNFGFIMRKLCWSTMSWSLLKDAIGRSGLENFRIRGNIVSVCADTKGAHEMGGSRVLLQKNVATFVQLNDLTLIL